MFNNCDSKTNGEVHYFDPINKIIENLQNQKKYK